MRLPTLARLLAPLVFATGAHAHLPPIDASLRDRFVAPTAVVPAANFVLTATYLAATPGTAAPLAG